ncbi:MAG: TraR/DksA family transcriptional regulator [Burkholderiales bacterium]|nr:TraR/DksA family transcriptional regulator [Burkholderiales bacterium]
MKTPQDNPLRDRLLSMRAALLTQLADQQSEVVHRADASSEHFGHPDEAGAKLASDRELLAALGERETAELAAIDAALARMADGSYGECVDCGVDIAPARLQATPEAPRCIACQEKVERQRA